MEKNKNCPKCGYSNKDEFDTCPSCGIVIRKYYEIEERKLNIAQAGRESYHSKKPFFFKTVIGLFLLYGIYSIFLINAEIVHPPGVIVKKQPLQYKDNAKSWSFKEYRIIPLAKFIIKARVLSKERYYFDRESELSKYDLALGWQEMSDSEVLGKLSIGQSRRWYFWKWKKSPPIPAKQIPIKSANMHIISGNPGVENALKQISKGSIIDIEGYLIKAQNSNGWKWKSSLSRYDTGNHSCEVVWVDKLLLVN